MYLCMYTNIIWLHMIKARIRWCACRVENILTLGKLLSLWFCFLLHSILFLISQTSYRTYKIISRYELARPIMGTIFLVYTRKMVPITERARLFLLVFKNKIERRGRQNKNKQAYQFTQCYNILHRLQVHHPILTLIIHDKYIIYIHTYIYIYFVLVNFY